MNLELTHKEDDPFNIEYFRIAGDVSTNFDYIISIRVSVFALNTEEKSITSFEKDFSLPTEEESCLLYVRMLRLVFEKGKRNRSEEIKDFLHKINII